MTVLELIVGKVLENIMMQTGTPSVKLVGKLSGFDTPFQGTRKKYRI